MRRQRLPKKSENPEIGFDWERDLKKLRASAFAQQFEADDPDISAFIASGGKLILCNIDPQIHEVFEITKLDKFFKIMKEEQQALQAF